MVVFTLFIILFIIGLIWDDYHYQNIELNNGYYYPKYKDKYIIISIFNKPLLTDNKYSLPKFKSKETAKMYYNKWLKLYKSNNL